MDRTPRRRRPAAWPVIVAILCAWLLGGCSLGATPIPAGPAPDAGATIAAAALGGRDRATAGAAAAPEGAATFQAAATDVGATAAPAVPAQDGGIATAPPSPPARASSTPRASPTPAARASSTPHASSTLQAVATPAGGGLSIATPRPGDRMPTVRATGLPVEARRVIALIAAGGPFPYRQDGVTFENRENLLPRQPSGYYREYTVDTPGSPDRGPRRLVRGKAGELYYTDDHYASFKRVVP